MTRVRADVAAMLHAGATYTEIKQALGVSDRTVSHARRTLGIPLPPGRSKRTPAEQAARKDQAVAMLHAGATYQQIYRQTSLSHRDIASLRRQHNIPIPDRDHGGRSRTVDEAFALHTTPTHDGHLIWTGSRNDRRFALIASGRKHNPRAVAFQKHYGREPEGRIWRKRTCTEPDCIAGAHHTDHRIRQADSRADHAYGVIFGTGDAP